MAEVLSGCVVRAAIQQERSADDENDGHYLSVIKRRLNVLYEMTSEPNIREQISDEVSWINGKLGVDE